MVNDTRPVIAVTQPYASFLVERAGPLSTLVSGAPMPPGDVDVFATGLFAPGGRVGDWAIEWHGNGWTAVHSTIRELRMPLPCNRFVGTVEVIESLPIYDVDAPEATGDGRYAVAAPPITVPSGRELGGFRVLEQDGPSTIVESLHREEPYLNVEPGRYAVMIRNPRPAPADTAGTGFYPPPSTRGPVYIPAVDVARYRLLPWERSSFPDGNDDRVGLSARTRR